MTVIIIGAGGAIGKTITPAIQVVHKVITVGRNSGDILVDISSVADLEHLFKQTGKVDAIICVAGDSVTSDLQSMDKEKFEVGIQQKLLAQTNLVLIGLDYLNDNGSLTLISGKMGERPAKGSTGKALANGAVNSFVMAAALEMPRGIRINTISPSKLSEISPDDLIRAYQKCMETLINGEIVRIGYS